MHQEKFKVIHDRFLRDHVFRERMIENSRDEEVCRAWDVLADEDHTYHMSQEEYFYYRNKWWLYLNQSGNDTLPLRKRSVFKQALSTLNRLHREAGGRTHRAHSLLEVHTMETSIEFFFHLVAMERILVVFLRIRRKSIKEDACKGLRSNGATRCLQIFGENLRRMAFTNLFYFVTDRSFTADGGLL